MNYNVVQIVQILFTFIWCEPLTILTISERWIRTYAHYAQSFTIDHIHMLELAFHTKKHENFGLGFQKKLSTKNKLSAKK